MRCLYKYVFVNDNPDKYIAKANIDDSLPNTNCVINSVSMSSAPLYYTLSGSSNPAPQTQTLQPGVYVFEAIGAGGGGGAGENGDGAADYSGGAGAAGGAISEIVVIPTATSYTVYAGAGGGGASAPANQHFQGAGGGGGGAGSGFTASGYTLYAAGGGGGSGASAYDKSLNGVTASGAGGTGGALGSGGSGANGNTGTYIWSGTATLGYTELPTHEYWQNDVSYDNYGYWVFDEFSSFVTSVSSPLSSSTYISVSITSYTTVYNPNSSYYIGPNITYSSYSAPYTWRVTNTYPGGAGGAKGGYAWSAISGGPIGGASVSQNGNGNAGTPGGNNRDGTTGGGASGGGAGGVGGAGGSGAAGSATIYKVN
jgi:hypothetical protein